MNSSILYKFDMNNNTSFLVGSSQSANNETNLQNILFGVLAATLSVGSLIVAILQYLKRHPAVLLIMAPECRIGDIEQGGCSFAHVEWFSLN